MNLKGLKTRVVAFLGVSSLLPAMAFATAPTIDTTAITDACTAAAAAIAVVGLAVVGGPIVVRATYRWIKGSV